MITTDRGGGERREQLRRHDPRWFYEQRPAHFYRKPKPCRYKSARRGRA